MSLERRSAGLDAAGWLNLAAYGATILAADIGFQGVRDLGSIALDFAAAPPELSHAAFHLSVAGGFALALAILLAYLFWVPIRRGDLAAFGAALGAGITEVALLLEPIRRELLPHTYGHEHPSVWVIVVLWPLTLGAGALGLRLARHDSSRRRA